MFNFMRKAGVKMTFGSALKAARDNDEITQRQIARFVLDEIHRLTTEGASMDDWRATAATAMSGRHHASSMGINSESNPFYAKYALLESACHAVLLGDDGLKKHVLGELFSWFRAIGLE